MYGPDKKPLKDKSWQQILLVVDDLKNNLLRLPAIFTLHLATQMIQTETLENKSYYRDTIYRYNLLYVSPYIPLLLCQ